MNFCFLNADKLLHGIELVADDLGITLTNRENADVVVGISEEKPEMGCMVSLCRNKAVILYKGGYARFFRGLATLVQWVKNGETVKALTETPLFDTNGAMIDVSRNAVMNLKTVKFMMRKMALMGMNTFMLYTEDTYEIEGYPYFGHLRGRYTKEELKELDAYAASLGIELIPCIQTLGHLATMLKWSASAAIKDTANALLAGSEKTYALIDQMFKTVSECFTTKRIHIGMDETHDLGTGKYLDTVGYRPREEVFFEHLRKVSEIADKYGFKPMMWSDMFFRMSAKGMENFEDYDMRTVLTNGIENKLPENVQPVFWDYYHPNEEFYSVNIRKHAIFRSKALFAGGVWMWSGHCPMFSRSLRNTIPALDACRKNGIKEVIATVWHNGSESCLPLSLAGLAWYADYDYKGSYSNDSVSTCFKAACGEDYDTVIMAELPDHPHGGEVGISKALMNNDPLLGFFDSHVDGVNTAEYYTAVTKKLRDNNVGIFEPAMDVIRAFSDTLINKADFGVRLKTAYDKKDRDALRTLKNECDIIAEKIKKLRAVHRKAWMEYNKSFGWEVHDIRYGGMIARFDTVKNTITAYIDGEIEKIEELEAPRLPFDGNYDDKFGGSFLWLPYSRTATAGTL